MKRTIHGDRFDRNEKRIVLSHTRLWEQVKTDEKNALAERSKG